MTIHDLKVWREPWEALRHQQKRFEFRKNDRSFKAGDLLRLHLWDPERGEFLMEPPLVFRVTYIAFGSEHGIPVGYVIMSIEPVDVLQ